MTGTTPETPSPIAPRAPGGRLKKALVALLVVVALVAVFWRPVLMAAGRFLVVDEEPVASDVVVVSGGRVDRILYGVEMVKRGVAPRLLVLANPDDCPEFWGYACDETMRRRLVELGLRPEQVLVDTRPHSTRTDAVFARKTMEREGLASAVVVSDPFHMRRVALSWRRVFASSDARLTFSAIPWAESRLALDGWWGREQELVFVFQEYAKLAFYWVKGYL